MNRNSIYRIARKITNQAGTMNTIIRKCLYEYLQVGDIVYYEKTVGSEKKEIPIEIEEFIILDEAPESYLKKGIRGYRTDILGNRIVDIPVNNIVWDKAITLIAKREMSAEEFVYTIKPELKIADKYDVDLTDNLNIGIEIEGGTDYVDVLDEIAEVGFHTAHDSSVDVRTDFSDELVYDGYEQGHEILRKVYKAIFLLKDANFVYNDSCGTHIHVSSADKEQGEHAFDFKFILQFLRFYVEFEDYFYQLLENHRCESRHSRKMKESNRRFYDFIKNIPMALLCSGLDEEGLKSLIGTSWYNSQEYRRYGHDKYNDTRYTGLNVHSLFYRGTLEFRHFSGDYESLPYMLDIVDKMISYVKEEGIVNALTKMNEYDLTDEGNMVRFLIKMGVSSKTTAYFVSRMDGVSSFDDALEMINNWLTDKDKEKEKEKRIKMNQWLIFDDTSSSSISYDAGNYTFSYSFS